MRELKESMMFKIVIQVASLAVCLSIASTGHAQIFNSGSDGSDGALSLTTAGTYTFDPFDTALFGKVLDPDGDGVFNFTTITIGQGVTLRFSGAIYNRPVYFLASGAVAIDGTLDLNGQTTPNPVQTPLDFDARRNSLTVPGSGGFRGGAGGAGGVNPQIPATPGQGPGGGSGGIACNLGAAGTCGKGGRFSSNRYLIPLIGGSGGEGSIHFGTNYFYYGGGAGGGAILIASSNSITISATGKISANGGEGYSGGGGSGGAIRLVAPHISSVGLVSALAIRNQLVVNSGTNGVIRLESYTSNIVASSTTPPAINASPSKLVTPTGSLRIVSINGINIPVNPAGRFNLPGSPVPVDVEITAQGSIQIVLEGKNIPTNTPVKLRIFSQDPTDVSVIDDVVSATLTTIPNSSNLTGATVNYTFPTGYSRCVLEATW